MRFIKILFVSLLFFSASQAILAQSGNVRGFVYLEKTGEPAIYTNVYLQGTTYGTTTDDNGYFNLSKIPTGKYKLIASSIGYEPAVVEIELVKNNQIVDEKLFLAESAVKLDVVTISADKVEMQTSVKMSVVKLTPKDIKKMPSIGGDPDLAQYLQVLPGVVFTGDQGGQLYIRGGSPIQNKVLLDGMIIYNPFHSIGLFSVFDTDILRTADVYTGGFSAEYGGRISSIMDIKTKDGNKLKTTGKVSANTFGSKLLLEGPLKKPTTPGGGSKSYIFSAKTSYLDQTSKSIYSYVSEDGLPYNYTDLYGKISLNGSNGSKVNFFGFNFKDKVNYPKVAGFEWNQFGGGTNFVLIPARSTVLIDGTIAYSNYETSAIENETTAAVKERTSIINGFNAAMNFTNFNGDNESKFGFEILGFKTNFNFMNSVNQKISQVENTTEIAGYLQYKYNIGKLVLEPSFRMHYYASLATFSPEPRLGFKYNVTDKVRLKGAGGLYSQNLLSATSDRDVVNLFYGFLSGPDNLQDKFKEQDGTVTTLKDKLQKARHAIFGIEFDITKNILLNVEGYYKHFNQLTNVNRNKLYEDNTDNKDIADELKKDYIVEKGDAYGVDMSVKYTKKQTSIWFVYSISKVERWDGTQAYYPLFDRRHNVNFVASKSFGEDHLWTVDARWNIGSGFPLTQTTGFYENLDLSGSINQDYTTVHGDLGIRYGSLNGGRLPFYHRFDVSVTKKFVLSENSILEASASVTNVYNRDNIFYVNRVTSERVNQLPILPSIGLNLTF
ncbi:MAG: TonB-dependent receptor [Bacteroidetes bacterium]|nr:MAG: TonB-dependent receptor [Bacteroidota bacterium]